MNSSCGDYATALLLILLKLPNYYHAQDDQHYAERAPQADRALWQS